MLAQQIVLRQLEAVLSIHKLARLGNHLDAIKEVAKLPFLPLDPRTPDFAMDIFQNLSHHVQACVPDLLKVALHCLDNVKDTDGSLRALRAKVNFTAYMFMFILFHCLWLCSYFPLELYPLCLLFPLSSYVVCLSFTNVLLSSDFR